MTAWTDKQLLLGDDMKRRANSKGDVAWYVAGEENPIGYSTIATVDLIAELLKEYKDLRELLKHIHNDETAKKIVQAYIDRGVYEITAK